MEKQLKCVMLLSLKEMALRSIAASLWNDPDILFSSSKFGPSEEKNWQEFVDQRIREKIMKLSIPGSLQEPLTDFIGPISLEVKKWEENFQSFQDSNGDKVILSGSTKLCWTSAGTINYQETAKNLILSDEMNIETRYELACYYCLEDDISLYWNKLPEEKKMQYGGSMIGALPCLPYCWPVILQGKQSNLDYLWKTSDEILATFNQCAFEFYAGVCCKAAAKYFFQKLTAEEKTASLMRSFKAALDNQSMSIYPKEKLSSVLYFLLSVMTPEQQLEAIKAHPVDVLYCFLQWPLQDLFLENADLFWTSLPSSSYPDLVKKIVGGYKNSDFYFPKMFQLFFKQSPQDFKNSFLEEIPAGFWFMTEFFPKKDVESIRVFFRAMDAADRVKAVFQGDVLEFFYYQILRHDRDLVEVVFREFTLSKEQRDMLSRIFMGSLGYQCGSASEVRTMLSFLDKLVVDSNDLKKGEKRKLGNCSSE